ncbi:threonine/homoserine/homoserine lactone efflux protein [Humibacillus xanthopallidus]|uniref:Threonine/homoserine/homoserine lactone efflux protein n=1 Tax=Humibacillus xanthopallidus TaxID=412689 RepID=A0A543PKW0_9MICO|nr:LysE family translocator [Humibacillus xanthopallidus]TQN44716.1 threonine/homoserine/homoserine lactone efflux protein [Humibacillus xanthopallidus]
MTWHAFSSFVVFAAVVSVIPGPDFVVVLRSAVVGGRPRGLWAAAGVTTSNAVQGLAVAVGLGAFIVASQPLFTAIKWAGVGYLLFLAARTLRSAFRGDYELDLGDAPERRDRSRAWLGWRAGFTSNITNPKVLAFYLAVLPQFLPDGVAPVEVVGLALTHAVISAVFLVLVTLSAHAARRVLTRRRVRRGVDVVTGTAMLGFGARWAFESA